MMGRSLHDLEAKYSNSGALPPSGSPHEQAKALISRKEELEAQLEAYASVLRTNETDLTSPLTDSEGFPRSDIPDIASVRTARAKIHELRNDLRDNQGRLKEVMEKVFAKPAGKEDQPVETVSPPPATVEPAATTSTMAPFAVVSSVAASSPAALAGLKPQDQILRFGTINATNYDSLTAVGRLVRDNDGEQVEVVVMRDAEGGRRMKRMELVPMDGWGGRGKLGCHILPIP